MRHVHVPYTVSDYFSRCSMETRNSTQQYLDEWVTGMTGIRIQWSCMCCHSGRRVVFTPRHLTDVNTIKPFFEKTWISFSQLRFRVSRSSVKVQSHHTVSWNRHTHTQKKHVLLYFKDNKYTMKMPYYKGLSKEKCLNAWVNSCYKLYHL